MDKQYLQLLEWLVRPVEAPEEVMGVAGPLLKFGRTPREIKVSYARRLLAQKAEAPRLKAVF